MTRWGLLVLVSSFALGLSGLDRAKASRAAVWITAVVVLAVSVRNGAL